MQTVVLDRKKHNRKRFDCGVEPLNNYLAMMVNQQGAKDNARTFVLEDRLTPAHVVGYYTLTMTSMDLGALPVSLQRKLLVASGPVAFPLVVVGAKAEGAVGFYERFGFASFMDISDQLYMSVADVRASLVTGGG
ncbi:MAG: GNAT family N-acetyltransferase [Thiolinea sp.]